MAIDLSKLSQQDLEALNAGDLGKMSTEALEWIGRDGEGEPTPPKTWARRATDAVVPYVKPALETAGMLVGGAVGGAAGLASPIPGGAAGGAIAGAGLGAGIGAQAGNLVEQAAGMRQPKGVVPEVINAATDVATGAMGEMGGQVAGKVVKEIGKKLSPYAESLYAYAINTPMGKKWSELFKGHELTAREALVKAGLDDEVLPNKFGLQKATAKVNGMVKLISKMADDLTEAGVTAPVSSVTRSPEVAKVAGKAWASGESKVAQDTVKAVVEDVTKKAGVSSTLNPSQLLGIKQQLADEVAWEAKNTLVNVKGQFTQEAKKAMSEAAMKALESMNPEIKYLSEKAAARIDLKKAIEYTIDRDFGKDMVGATSKMLALKNIGMAILDNFLGYHTNRARLAFVLKKAGDYEAKVLSRGAAYGAAKSMRPEEAGGGETVYRYNAQGQRMVQ